jgi:hypothetical protein
MPKVTTEKNIKTWEIILLNKNPKFQDNLSEISNEKRLNINTIINNSLIEN